MQQGGPQEQGASAMTAAATETACSLRLSSAGATLQSFSQPGTGCSVSESTVQHLLASIRQTAEAAEQIRWQRDALSQPRQQQQQQSGVSAPRSPVSAALNRLLSESVRSNQLQQLASLLATSSTPAAAAQQVLEVPPDSPAVPDRQLRHMTSRADSSTLEAAAADALLDLEFAARDAGSFTQHRAQLATMFARAAAEQQQRDAGASLQLASPRAAVTEEAAAAPVMLGATHRASSVGPSASAPVAGAAGVAAAATAQPDPSCGPAASAPAAAAADSDSSAARQRLQQELLALLSRHVAGLSQADADQNGWTHVPGSAHTSVPGAAGADAPQPAAAGAATAAATAAAHLTINKPEPNECPAAPSDDVPIFPVLQRVQQHLLAKQQDTAAAAAGAAGGPARTGSTGFLHRLLHASQRLQDGAADPDTLSGRQLGEDHQGLLLRSASNLTSNTVLARPESVAAVSRAAALAAAAEASRAQHLSLLQAQARSAEGPYPSYLDADLLTLFYEFKATRQQVAAILREAVEQGVMHTGLIRRLQQLRQRVVDSPSFTLPPTAATEAAPAAGTGTQPSAAAPSRLASKRSRDQQCGGDAAAAAAADTAAEADAPVSKLRRTETMKSGGTATPPPPAAAAAIADGAEPMDVSAPADSAAGAASGTRKAAPAADVAAGPQAEPDSPAAATAAAAPTDVAAAPAGEGGLLARSVECLVQVHRLTNRMLAKAVSAKKEGIEAARRAEDLSALAATANSTTQQLQLQVQMLQQQLQARQQQVHVRSQQAAIAYPQLVSQVVKSVSLLVTTASNSSLPVEHRKALAGIADELLHNCQC